MAFVRTVKSKDNEYIQLLESYREDGKPKHRVIENLGKVLPPSGIEAAIWSKAHTLGHITIKKADSLLSSIPEAIDNGVADLPCCLVPAGKFRNGRPRWWCRTHQVHFGKKSDIHQCSHANYEMNIAKKPVEIDPRKYPGELAIWYALPPAICTRPDGCDQKTGIHVHGRVEAGGKKTLDKTYPCVVVGVEDKLQVSCDWIVITPPAAEAWLWATENKVPMVVEKCSHCSAPHLDLGYFAQQPHKMHLCGNCGREFWAKSHCVSNPLILLADLLETRNRTFEPAPISININSNDYLGGFEIYPSTPAIVWTADRPQQVGIHVHGYDASGKRTLDETFAGVSLDGTNLDRVDLVNRLLHTYHKPKAGDLYTAHPSDL
ncbi:MAG: hypothetical protein RMY34_23275 [Aulosira sp. DedQUE10]|nr:hypothetical protein [Aulosira sp. DedQUE10]